MLFGYSISFYFVRIVDTEKPTFRYCPDEEIVIEPLTAPNISNPEVIDNSGGYESLVTDPLYFTTNIVLKEDLTVTYIATDYSGNVGTCILNIRIRGKS